MFMSFQYIIIGVKDHQTRNSFSAMTNFDTKIEKTYFVILIYHICLYVCMYILIFYKNNLRFYFILNF